MRSSTVRREWLVWFGAIALSVLGLAPSPVSAATAKEYVAKFTFRNEQPTQRTALQFELLGVLPQDVSVKILPGSRFQGPIRIESLTTRTRVSIAGSVRAVNNGQTAEIEIRLKNGKKEARISDPRWGFLVDGAVPAGVLVPAGKPRILGGKWQLDPVFTAFNDIADLGFGVRNLQLFTNVLPDDFEAIDLQALLDASFDSLLPSFFLSPGVSSDDLGLLFDVFPEPSPGRFLVATGQIVDESGNPVGAFIHGIQAIPGPSGLMLLAAGGCALCVHRSRRRREARRGVTMPSGAGSRRARDRSRPRTRA